MATVTAQHGTAPEGLSVSAKHVHGLFADAFADGLHLSLLVAGIATLLGPWRRGSCHDSNHSHAGCAADAGVRVRAALHHVSWKPQAARPGSPAWPGSVLARRVVPLRTVSDLDDVDSRAAQHVEVLGV